VGRTAALERALTFTGPRFVRAFLPENTWLTPGTHYRCEIDAAEPFFVDLEYVSSDPLGPAWRVTPDPRKIQELFGQNRRPLSDENALTLEVTIRSERPG
jgi:hypothetical protein